MVDGKVRIKYDNLHNMLKKFVIDKVTIQNYVNEDMDLVDAEDHINENDPAIFDLPEDHLNTYDEEIALIEHLEQDLMNITEPDEK